MSDPQTSSLNALSFLDGEWIQLPDWRKRGSEAIAGYPTIDGAKFRPSGLFKGTVNRGHLSRQKEAANSASATAIYRLTTQGDVQDPTAGTVANGEQQASEGSPSFISTECTVPSGFWLRFTLPAIFNSSPSFPAGVTAMRIVPGDSEVRWKALALAQTPLTDTERERQGWDQLCGRFHIYSAAIYPSQKMLDEGGALESQTWQDVEHGRPILISAEDLGNRHLFTGKLILDRNVSDFKGNKHDSEDDLAEAECFNSEATTLIVKPQKEDTLPAPLSSKTSGSSPSSSPAKCVIWSERD